MSGSGATRAPLPLSAQIDDTKYRLSPRYSLSDHVHLVTDQGDNLMTTNTNITTAPAPEQQVSGPPPDAQLLQIVGGAFLSQAAYVAAKLGITDLLADGAKSIEYLSVATGTHERSLYRVLRALAAAKVFTELEDKRFANTPVSELLGSDHPRSLRDATIWMNEEPHWRVYGHLMHSVKTGETAWEHVHGEPVFQYLFQTNKELGDIFNRAVTSYSHQSIGPVLDAYDFSDVTVIADIAGGYGHLLAAVLASNPRAKGILFDLASVLEGAPSMLKSYGVPDRVEIVPGDFFREIPVRADLYILKHIIHDWDDDRNRTILENIRRNMPDHARVLIVDAVVPDPNEPHFSKIIDLEMLMAPGGVERTASEFAELLDSAGLRLNRIIPTAGPVSIVEAVKV